MRQPRRLFLPAHKVCSRRTPASVSRPKFLLGKPLQRNEAMASPVIKRHADLYKIADATTSDDRFLVITLLCFAVFLRIDERLCSELFHIHSHDHSPSKEQLRPGHIIYISRLNSQYCPVQHTVEFSTKDSLIQTMMLTCCPDCSRPRKGISPLKFRSFLLDS